MNRYKIKISKNHLNKGSALIFLLVFAVVGVNLLLQSHADSPSQNLGESYQICSEQSQYLTSPYTYNSLASGSQNYTVAQYEALPGYGTTLPSLPSYISGQSSSTEAAVIFAPGASVNLPAYDFPATPMIYFFEGGNYGQLGLSAENGDEFIGGSASGFGEPVFNMNGSGSDAIVRTNTNTPTSIATIGGSSTLGVGTTTFTLTSSSLPIVPGENLLIGSGDYVVASVSGPQSGYSVTLQSNTPIATSTPVGTSVTYDNNAAGGVTVNYLTIENNPTNSDGTIYSGADWTIENNYIHGGNGGAVGTGMAIYDASTQFSNKTYSDAHWHGGTIEYNCLEDEGHSGIHEFGYSSVFAYNEVENVPTNANDTSGDESNKWWGTLNSQIYDNSFVQDGLTGSADIWLDNGNTGFYISGNYFDDTYGTAISVETGFNGDITDNLFLDGGWGQANSNSNPSTNEAIGINQSGAWNIPGSNYNNELQITNNTLTDNWGNIGIWSSGSRSCSNPQEQAGTSPWNNSSYCTGGFPNGDGDFSIYNYPNGNDSTFGSLTSSASSGATTLVVNASPYPTPAVGDYIGFSGVGSSGYPLTSSTSTAAVTSFTGTQSLIVASATGFPSSGNIQTAVSNANAEGNVVGATFSYNGVSGNTLENVSLINPSLYSSSTDVVNGGYVKAFEPYKITAVSGANPDLQLTISPGLSSSESASATLYNDGTCYDDLTSVATPTSPAAPDGSSYFDGCTWESRNITVSNNTENFTPSDITSGPNLWGSTAYQSCVSGSSSNFCGTNFDEYQPGYYPGGNAAGPYYTYENEMEDAFLANPNFTTPITSHWYGAPPGNNGEAAWNITWTGNTYNGPINFFTGIFGNCNLPSPWNCFVNVASWESSGSGGWDNDNNAATTTPPTVSFSAPANNAYVHGSSVTVAATATANDNGSISSCSLLVNSISVQTLTTSPYNFTLNPLNYSDGSQTLEVQCTDNLGDVGNQTLSVIVNNGDLNADGKVNISDLAILASNWNKTGQTYAQGDINGDGKVNIQDLALLAANWGW